MNENTAKATTMDIVGGVYVERCMKPNWWEIFGSAGRSASAVSNMGIPVTLHSYLDDQTYGVISSRSAFEGYKFIRNPIIKSFIFDYDHGLATPRIIGEKILSPAIQVNADYILRFGLIEGDAIVHGHRVVYDPQNPSAPTAFKANGSTADELAVILNRYEATALAAMPNVSMQSIAEAVATIENARVVVIKLGAAGALVFERDKMDLIPAYRSTSVWKIGSGDNFAAHFAFRWMCEQRPAAESADLASQATAYYCQTRNFPTHSSLQTFHAQPIIVSAEIHGGRKPSVYLAGPFFTLAQLWLIEQARRDLSNMGLKVFSPYHDVGLGSAADVVKRDLEGIEHADIVFAIADGLDSGTIFEIGYACAISKPVIIYCENEKDEDMKMMEGSNCLICNDYVSAVYQTVWTTCTQ